MGLAEYKERWAHGSDSINFIAMDDDELVFVDTATKHGGHDMPREEPDQERFERIAALHLAEAEVEGLTSIRYDIVSLLVAGSEKASCVITSVFRQVRGATSCISSYKIQVENIDCTE